MTWISLVTVWLLGSGAFSRNKQTWPQVYPELKHDTSLPLGRVKLDRPFEESGADEAEQIREGVGTAKPKQPLAAANPSRTRLSATRWMVNHTVQKSAVAASAALTPGLNFDGLSGTGAFPTPDANGAAGATQYVQAVNARFAVYSKTNGTLLYGPVGLNSVWSGFGGPCENTNQGDPIVQYDKSAGRWVISRHAQKLGGPNFQCVAVSTTSDATGSYNLYSFSLPNLFPDYPKLAVWPDAYYLSTNLLDASNNYSFVGALVCALDRNAMLAGASATSICFQTSPSFSSLLPADLDGSILPLSGAPEYVLNLDVNSLNLWQFHVDFQTPANSTFSGPINISVASFTQACSGGKGFCIPQQGTTQKLDSLHDRLMYRVAYRRFADGHESLLANHSVGSPSAIRWYEIQDPGGTPTVFQQGTYAPDSNYRWMGSIAMDQAGDIAVGYSISSTGMYAGIRVADRLPSDPLGTFESETDLLDGTAPQTGSNRWGDYSSMSVDPVDDCTFWYTNQYQTASGSSNWSTRIAFFKFGTCPNTAPVTLSPPGLSFGNQAVGTASSAQTITVNNNQQVPLNISNIGVTGDFAQTNMCGVNVSAGGSCTISVTFTPTASGTRTGSVTVTDDAGNSPQVANLTGTGLAAVLTLSATNLNFNFQPIGTTSAAKSVTLTNTGGAPVTVAGISVSGNYTESDNCAGTVLAPSATCSVSVSFAPVISGSIPGEVTISDDAANTPQLIALSGSGLNPVSFGPLNLSFGTVPVGATSASQTATLTNNLNTPLTFTFSASGGYTAVGSGSSPCGSTLAPKSKCTISVTLSPTTSGTFNGALTVVHNAAFSPQVVNLSGSGSGGAIPPLTFSPTSLSFTKVVVGTTSAAKTVTVTNSSSATVNILGIAGGGYFAASGSGANPCGGTLAPSAQCAVAVTFSPTNAGTFNGAVTITDDSAINPQILNLSGSTIQPVTLSATSLTFASQAVGTTSAAQVATLTNNQSSALTIQGIVASGDYVVSAAGSTPCAGTVAAHTQCTFGVAFSPAVTGTITGVVTVTHNANNSPQEVALTGTAQ